MLPVTVTDWLRDHGKGDLQECTWEELDALYAYLMEWN